MHRSTLLQLEYPSDIWEVVANSFNCMYVPNIFYIANRTQIWITKAHNQRSSSKFCKFRTMTCFSEFRDIEDQYKFKIKFYNLKVPPNICYYLLAERIHLRYQTCIIPVYGNRWFKNWVLIPLGNIQWNQEMTAISF